MANQNKVFVHDFFQTLVSIDFSKYREIKDQASCFIVLSLIKKLSLKFVPTGQEDSVFCSICPFRRKESRDIEGTNTLMKRLLNYCHFFNEEKSSYWKEEPSKTGGSIVTNITHYSLSNDFQKELIKEFPNLLLEEKD